MVGVESQLGPTLTDLAKFEQDTKGIAPGDYLQLSLNGTAVVESRKHRSSTPAPMRPPPTPPPPNAAARSPKVLDPPRARTLRSTLSWERDCHEQDADRHAHRGPRRGGRHRLLLHRLRRRRRPHRIRAGQGTPYSCPGAAASLRRLRHLPRRRRSGASSRSPSSPRASKRWPSPSTPASKSRPTPSPTSTSSRWPASSTSTSCRPRPAGPTCTPAASSGSSTAWSRCRCTPSSMTPGSSSAASTPPKSTPWSAPWPGSAWPTPDHRLRSIEKAQPDSFVHALQARPMPPPSPSSTGAARSCRPAPGADSELISFSNSLDQISQTIAANDNNVQALLAKGVPTETALNTFGAE